MAQTLVGFDRGRAGSRSKTMKTTRSTTTRKSETGQQVAVSGTERAGGLRRPAAGQGGVFASPAPVVVREAFWLLQFNRGWTMAEIARREGSSRGESAGSQPGRERGGYPRSGNPENGNPGNRMVCKRRGEIVRPARRQEMKTGTTRGDRPGWCRSFRSDRSLPSRPARTTGRSGRARSSVAWSVPDRAWTTTPP